MSSLPLLTLNRLALVALRSGFCPLKFPHWSKRLPIDEGPFLPSGHKRSEGLLFRLGRRDALRTTFLLSISKRGVEV